MTYSGATENLGLPQYTDDDQPTWRGDMNEAFRLIDKAIADNDGAVRQYIADELAKRDKQIQQNIKDISADQSNVQAYSSTTRPVYGIADEGTLIYDRDLKRVLLWNGRTYTGMNGEAI